MVFILFSAALKFFFLSLSVGLCWRPDSGTLEIMPVKFLPYTEKNLASSCFKTEFAVSFSKRTDCLFVGCGSSIVSTEKGVVGVLTNVDDPDAIGVEHVWVCADGVCGSLKVGVEINDDNDDDDDDDDDDNDVLCTMLGEVNWFDTDGNVGVCGKWVDEVDDVDVREDSVETVGILGVGLYIYWHGEHKFKVCNFL